MKECKLTQETLENLLTLLLYRLGGEQSFVQEDIEFINKQIGGATLTVDSAGKMILKCRTRESMKNLKEEIKKVRYGKKTKR